MNRHRHYWQKIPHIAIILFIVGLIGGVAFRLTPFLKSFDPRIADIVWYVAGVAYAIFYAVRIAIENHRREICQPELMRRLKENKLQPEDIAQLDDMLHSHCRSKVKYNYLVWFAISVLSIVGAALFT